MWPEDAVVTLNGSEPNVGGVVFESLTPGPHTLRITRDGFTTQRLTLAIAPGERMEQHVELVGEEVTLTVRTIPDAAAVNVRAGTTVLRGNAPFEAVIPAGLIEVRVSLEDHNDEVHTWFIDSTREESVWLDPTGQLLDLQRAVETCNQPKQVVITPDGTQMWVT